MEEREKKRSKGKKEKYSPNLYHIYYSNSFLFFPFSAGRDRVVSIWELENHSLTKTIPVYEVRNGRVNKRVLFEHIFCLCGHLTMKNICLSPPLQLMIKLLALSDKMHEE